MSIAHRLTLTMLPTDEFIYDIAHGKYCMVIAQLFLKVRMIVAHGKERCISFSSMQCSKILERNLANCYTPKIVATGGATTVLPFGQRNSTAAAETVALD